MLDGPLAPRHALLPDPSPAPRREEIQRLAREASAEVGELARAGTWIEAIHVYRRETRARPEAVAVVKWLGSSTPRDSRSNARPTIHSPQDDRDDS